MEGEEIGMVLARASELRSKVNICIVDRVLKRGGGSGSDPGVEGGGGHEEHGSEQDVDESLLGIRDALTSLEQQLSSLQDLQQQQQYERESTLAEIDRGRMILLSKLKEYKGGNLEVIHEATAFAGETNIHDDDLLLPPYPRQLPETLVLDDLYTSNFASKNRHAQCGVNGESAREIKNSESLRKKQVKRAGGNGGRGLRPIIWSALAIAGFVSVVSLAGVHPPKLWNGVNLRLSGLFRKSSGEEKPDPFECPPGRILVMEDGERRCAVKERVEIPFDSDVTAPNLSYGFG